MYRARTPDRHDTNNVCEALHMYLATHFEIMTSGDLGSENTNRLPAAPQANWHVRVVALAWFQILFLSEAQAGGSSSTSFPVMIKAGWYGREATAI